MTKLFRKSKSQANFPMQRGRPREFDRDRALEAAMEVFWQKGYMQSSLNDLCVAMGIKPPSFYCAFETREKLFLETLRHYVEKYLGKIRRDFSDEPDVHMAFNKLFEGAVKIYTRQNLARGCFVSLSAVGLGDGESRIGEMLAAVDEESRNIFRKRLTRAVEEGQLPRECDVAAISGAILAFLKGVAAMARMDICQADLATIASRGLLLLPSKSKPNIPEK